MSIAKPSTEHAVVTALGSQPDATAAEIAAATGLGRSTIAKALARLERAGQVRRAAGGREGGRRLPDRWSPAAETKSSRRRPSDGGRLRPGELDRLVLDYLATHNDSGPLSPTAVANGLGRSSGAVGNCLARLTAAGRVRQGSERPRRYSAA
jgi:DNA-binding IclR family transcriptional regulator